MTTQLPLPSFTNFRLFVVDDSACDRSTYSQWIHHAAPFHLDIQEMETGAQTLKACARTPPHCILLGSQLSDMTGLEFLEKIRCAASDNPIIFFTGQDNKEMATQAIRLGAQDYFIKNTLSETFLWQQIHDAVNQHRHSKRIQALERQFTTIVQSSADGLVVVGTDGLIRFTNFAAEHLLKQSSAQLLGSPFEYPMIQGESKEIKIHYQDRPPTPVEIQVVPIEWEDQPAYLTSLRDLTERRKTEAEQLRHETERQYAQKLESLGVLAGGIAHDFNNLLMSIVARAGLALRALSPDSPAYKHLHIIEKSGLHGGELANQMLTFAGQTQLDFQAINLQEFIQDNKAFLRSIVPKHITLTLNVSTNLPLIRGDRAQLRQLLMNSITNAAEGIDNPDGTIQISTNEIDTSTQDFRPYHILGDLPWGPCVLLTIQDTGNGIKTELIEKIFDPFFSTKSPGRGLGLATLLGIVRGHGAAIAVKSCIGHGTEFLFLFPITKKPLTQSSVSLTLPKDPIIHTIPSKVLIVDDEEEIRTTCSLILQEIGLDALVAHDGKSGEHIFEQYQHEIALVFLDLTMPGLDGGKLAEKIRLKNSNVPILVSSGYTEHETMKHFAQSSIDAFIQKPFQVDMLITKVQELIGSKMKSEK